MTFDPETYLSAAETARQTQDEAGPAVQITVLTFVWGQDWYALPLSAVREVIELERVTPIPGLPAHLLGATNHRGEVMAVIDARPLLALLPGSVNANSYLVVINVEEELVGLLVDQVGDIHDVAQVPPTEDDPHDHNHATAFSTVMMPDAEAQTLSLVNITYLVEKILTAT